MKYRFYINQNTIAIIMLLVQITTCAQVSKSGKLALLPARLAIVEAKFAEKDPAQEFGGSIQVVRTIQNLRNIIGKPEDIVYVKYHTNVGDGGGGHFMWRTDAAFLDLKDYFGKDNDGTLIKATGNNTGRWVRQYEGYINLKYFGATLLNANEKLQAAIDFAFNNHRDGTVTKGSTVFIPIGAWIIDNIELKNGVDLLGDSQDFTIIYPKTVKEGASNAPYLFEIPAGMVNVSISNLKIVARDEVPLKGCFHFKAAPGGVGDGGLWMSAFRRLIIQGFKGNALYFESGPQNLIPNQVLLFELVHANLSKMAPASSTCLKISGQHGQMTFINCGFNGYNDNNRFHTGRVVDISPNPAEAASYPAVLTFLNCTIQEGDYGFYITYSENITMDNCWFENLGNAITVDGTNIWCRNINVLNSRFANASGYGSIDIVAPNVTAGTCVNVINSQVKIVNSFVTVSDLQSNLLEDDYFITASGLPGAINPGVEAYGNGFASAKLSRTAGIIQTATPITDGIIECSHNKFVVAKEASTSINTINSTLNAGETLYIKASGTSVTFRQANSGNITLNKTALTLQDGEVAAFIKMDTDDGQEATYQLTSVIKNQ